MKIEVLIMQEGNNVYKSKGVEVREYLFSGRDSNRNKDEGRCANNIIYVPTQEDLDKYKGKLVDKTVIIDVSTIKVDFGGNVRVQGKLEPKGKEESKAA